MKFNTGRCLVQGTYYIGDSEKELRFVKVVEVSVLDYDYDTGFPEDEECRVIQEHVARQLPKQHFDIGIESYQWMCEACDYFVDHVKNLEKENLEYRNKFKEGELATITKGLEATAALASRLVVQLANFLESEQMGCRYHWDELLDEEEHDSTCVVCKKLNELKEEIEIVTKFSNLYNQKESSGENVGTESENNK